MLAFADLSIDQLPPHGLNVETRIWHPLTKHRPMDSDFIDRSTNTPAWRFSGESIDINYISILKAQ